MIISEQLRSMIAPWSSPKYNWKYQFIRALDYWSYRFDNTSIPRWLGYFRPRCSYCGALRWFTLGDWRSVILTLHGVKRRFHYHCFQFCFTQINSKLEQ